MEDPVRALGISLRTPAVYKGLLVVFILSLLALSPKLHAQSPWLSTGSDIYYSAGNVGIGISTPVLPLQIVGESKVNDWENTIWAQDSRPQEAGTGGGITFAGKYTTSGAQSSGGFIRIKKQNSISGNYEFDLLFGARAHGSVPTENMRIDGATGNVGIGTSTPRARFDIYNTQVYDTQEFFTGQDHILLSSTNPGKGNYFGGVSWTNGQRRRASIAAVMENADADFVGLAFFTRGVDGPGPFYESMRIAHNGKVGIGTTTPGNKLEVNGTIRSKEVIVEAVNWPDYVFEADYDLPTLGEIEAFIKANKHLPEVPPAAQMEEEGITLGEMNMLLLKKIEELTLHTISQDKQIRELLEMNNTLLSRIIKLEKDSNES